MSNIDKQALRQLATDAHELGIIKRYTKGIEANKRFAATATPLTVLALLDELEISQSENERLAKALTERNGEPVEGLVKRVAELEEIATDYGMKFQRAQDALRHQSLLHKSQLEAAKKRIAELRDWNAGLAQESFTYQQRVAELDNSLCELLPGIQYMDPPDGGNVTPLEQVRRMIADYRHRIAEQQKTLNAARSYVKSHAAGDGHAFGVLQAIDRAAGIGKGE